MGSNIMPPGRFTQTERQGTIGMKGRGLRNLSGLLALVLLTVLGSTPARADHALALGYEPGYPPGFSHFDYVNPEAPEGGRLVLSAFGSFDSLNPFLLKGLSAEGLSTLVFESLMEKSLDEPFSMYGLLAEDVELADDGLSVTFTLRPEARFSDGSPVTAADVVASFDFLKSEQAHPQYRFYWKDIEAAEALGERRVRFRFARKNPELHLIIGEMPVFARRWIGDQSFDEVVNEPPIASGPYVIEDYQPGKTITYRRNPDYWANDLNVRRGMFNFETVVYKYYKDRTVALEAFKAGEFDFFFENHSKRWARDHVGPRYDSGAIRKVELPHSNNAGMQGFVFNTRRDIFADRRVRRAITQAFDFRWANRNLFYGQYTRCDSYFSNSPLAAEGPATGLERELLQPFAEQLPDEIFQADWEPPRTEDYRALRENLIRAQRLLEEAGWQLEDGVRRKNGKALRFDILLASKGFERIMAPFVYNLEKLGIDASYRTVDLSIYQRRMNSFDFDMMVYSFGQSQSPGNELMNMFHSSSAERAGSRNLMGVSDPVVDALVEEIVYAPDREHLVAAARALDRVLLHGEYMVPNWYIDKHRLAFWDQFGRPETLPRFYEPISWMLKTWWVDPARADRLEAGEE